jgi:translation initiation factor 1
MAKKNISATSGFVFSTDPNFKIEDENQPVATVSPQEQRLKVSLQTKHRAGKTVTLITGFEGKLEDAEALGKKLRNFCGTGGSVKEDEIILQGDHRTKAMQFLTKNSFIKTKLI